MFYMYIRMTKSKKSKHPTIQIVEGVREGKKVKQKIIASLGVIKGPSDLEKLGKLAKHLIQRLEKEGLPPDGKVNLKSLVHQKTTYDGFGLAVDKLMQLSGFSEVVKKVQGRNKFDVENIVKLVLVQRFDMPGSKLRTYERQADHGFNDIDLQHIYRTMDAIEYLGHDIQTTAFNTVCAYSGGIVDCFFFDVTTLYFESVSQDDVRDFGYSKDQKHHSVQIVLALVVDAHGMPIAYEVFKGNIAETKTLIPVLELLRQRFSINNVTVVCDRGLASKPNVQALQGAQFHFVIATKLKSISRKFKINDLAEYHPLPGQELLEKNEQVLVRTMNHPQYQNTLLIATYSPNRAKKDREDRERMIEKLRKKLSDSSGEEAIKKVICNGGYKKFTRVKEGSLLTINQEAIEEDEKWDGFHGIAVSNSSGLTVEQALSRYRDLWHVEEAFRVAKSTLKTRPIFHWVPHRIRTHVLICFMNLFLERFLELLLKKAGTPLTPDSIRYALGRVHTVSFEETSTQKKGEMRSTLSEDAEKIFNVLGVSTDRSASILDGCCV
jgi:transposase